MAIIPVILSGGGGTRLWPMSTQERPKQFLELTGNTTMFRMTVDRVVDPARFAAPIIVTGHAHAAMVETQLKDGGIGSATVVLEPCARNTAPAIALAALSVADPTSVLLVMPSDHIIADVAAFHAATKAALPFVEQGWMATFAITATSPETGYGYIGVGAEIGEGVWLVDRFVEKPDREKAQAMLDTGGFGWNGGIFLFRADAYIGALAMHAPEVLSSAQQAIALAKRDGMRLSPDADALAACPSISIDFAVMEKAAGAGKLAVVPVSMGWSDVGSWDALYDIGDKDLDGNNVQGDVRLLDSKNCLIRSDGIRINAAGVENLIIVAVGNEVMIVPRGQSQVVKQFSE